MPLCPEFRGVTSGHPQGEQLGRLFSHQRELASCWGLTPKSGHLQAWPQERGEACRGLKATEALWAAAMEELGPEASPVRVPA